MWYRWSLRAKIVGLTVGVVLPIMAGTTALAVRLSRTALEDDIRSSGLALARELAASAASYTGKGEEAALKQEIGSVLGRGSLVRDATVYAVGPRGLVGYSYLGEKTSGMHPGRASQEGGRNTRGDPKMREGKVWLALLAAGALTLGAGVTLAATGQKAPEAAKTPAVSSTPVAPGTPEAKETKAGQQAEKAQALHGKGEKETALDRFVRGEVTAVEPTAKTLTVKALRGKAPATVGVEVPDTATITQGKATKTLADLQVGDRVWMKYDRMRDKLVADQIRILKPGKSASKSASQKKSS